MGIANKDRAIDSAVKQSLEDRIPKSRHSAFVEQAIADALRKEALNDLSRFLDELPKSRGDEDSTEVLRRHRTQWDGRPIEQLEGKGE